MNSAPEIFVQDKFASMLYVYLEDSIKHCCQDALATTRILVRVWDLFRMQILIKDGEGLT